MREFLSKIGIRNDGTLTTDNNFVVDLEDAEEYSKVFSRLDKSDLLEEAEDLSLVHEDASNVVYESDKYMINLIADFEHDVYRVVISELMTEEK